MKSELLKLGLNAQKAFKDSIDEKTKNKVLIEFSHNNFVNPYVLIGDNL